MSSPGVRDQSHAISVERITRTKRVGASMPVDSWLRVLREVADVDVSQESRRHVFGCAIVVLIVALVASLVFHAELSHALPVAVGLLLTVLVLVIGYYIWLRQSDLSNEFRVLLIPLLETLREDFRPDRPVALELDMRGLVGEKVVRQGKIAPPHGNHRIRSISQTIYLDPWCRVQGVLTGGHRMRLAVSSHYVRNVRSYISASGKSKSKTKWRKSVMVTASLAPALPHGIDRAKLPQQIHSGRCKVQQRRGRQLAVIRQKFKFKDSQAAVPPPEAIVKMFFALSASMTHGGKASDASPK